MERKLPAPECSDDANHRLYVAVNKKREEVVILRADLESMLVCHSNLGGDAPPSNLITAPTLRATRLPADRVKLFEFLKRHAKLHKRLHVQREWKKPRGKLERRLPKEV